MKSKIVFWFCLIAIHAKATTYHVSKNGNDKFSGTASRPFFTIQHAAKIARPGDVIMVHAGIYRERIDPVSSGTDKQRIVYQAAPDERVSIKGSEVVRNWQCISGDLWRVAIHNRIFGDFNPYSDAIRGDWFGHLDWVHHTGAVYINDRWLRETQNLSLLLQNPSQQGWSSVVGKDSTVIWARFTGANPNQALTEINVRQTVFYPSRPFINYITVRGFMLSQAATNWAPPTAEQKGLIGTHWSKGWIIEDNEVTYSRCSGISLGKYGDEWDNRSGDSAEGYVATVRRALDNKWDKAHIGGHLIRSNRIAHCGQAGIVGSLGGAFSTIIGNEIHDIYRQEKFSGAEMGGIKLHGAVDVLIKGNHIYRSDIGIWMDWMAQGTRVSGNLLHENNYDVFFEVDHGPYVVDNNLMLSERSLMNRSQGGAIVHNIMAGLCIGGEREGRETPYFDKHTTANMKLRFIDGGDSRWINNLYVKANNQTKNLPDSLMWGNLILDSASIVFTKGRDGYHLSLNVKDNPNKMVKPADARSFGLTKVSGQAFTDPAGRYFSFETDYQEVRRKGERVYPGPFSGTIAVKDKLVWPIPGAMRKVTTAE